MAFGVFVDPLEQRFEWSQSNIGIAYAVGMMVTAISSPWAGSLGDRLGAKKTMYFGIILFLVGMILTAFIREWFSWELMLLLIFLGPLSHLEILNYILFQDQYMLYL